MAMRSRSGSSGDLALDHPSDGRKLRSSRKHVENPGQRSADCCDPSRPWGHDSGREDPRGPLLSIQCLPIEISPLRERREDIPLLGELSCPATIQADAQADQVNA
jgi:hypothetical protein